MAKRVPTVQMRDSLSSLTTAAAALDALDVLANAAIDNEVQAAFHSALASSPLLHACEDIPPEPILRQIRDSYWKMGEDYLQDHPNETDILVFFHHWDENMRWEYKVVRVAGGFQHQTWLNGVLIG